jgi:hypothetical protein
VFVLQRKVAATVDRLCPNKMSNLSELSDTVQRSFGYAYGKETNGRTIIFEARSRVASALLRVKDPEGVFVFNDESAKELANLLFPHSHPTTYVKEYLNDVKAAIRDTQTFSPNSDFVKAVFVACYVGVAGALGKPREEAIEDFEVYNPRFGFEGASPYAGVAPPPVPASAPAASAPLSASGFYPELPPQSLYSVPMGMLRSFPEPSAPPALPRTSPEPSAPPESRRSSFYQAAVESNRRFAPPSFQVFEGLPEQNVMEETLAANFESKQSLGGVVLENASWLQTQTQTLLPTEAGSVQGAVTALANRALDDGANPDSLTVSSKSEVALTTTKDVILQASRDVRVDLSRVSEDTKAWATRMWATISFLLLFVAFFVPQQDSQRYTELLLALCFQLCAAKFSQESTGAFVLPDGGGQLVPYEPPAAGGRGGGGAASGGRGGDDRRSSFDGPGVLGETGTNAAAFVLGEAASVLGSSAAAARSVSVERRSRSPLVQREGETSKSFQRRVLEQANTDGNVEDARPRRSSFGGPVTGLLGAVVNAGTNVASAALAAPAAVVRAASPPREEARSSSPLVQREGESSKSFQRRVLARSSGGVLEGGAGCDDLLRGKRYLIRQDKAVLQDYFRQGLITREVLNCVLREQQTLQRESVRAQRESAPRVRSPSSTGRFLGLSGDFEEEPAAAGAGGRRGVLSQRYLQRTAEEDVQEQPAAAARLAPSAEDPVSANRREAAARLAPSEEDASTFSGAAAGSGGRAVRRSGTSLLAQIGKMALLGMTVQLASENPPASSSSLAVNPYMAMATLPTSPNPLFAPSPGPLTGALQSVGSQVALAASRAARLSPFTLPPVQLPPTDETREYVEALLKRGDPYVAYVREQGSFALKTYVLDPATNYWREVVSVPGMAYGVAFDRPAFGTQAYANTTSITAPPFQRR